MGIYRTTFIYEYMCVKNRNNILIHIMSILTRTAC